MKLALNSGSDDEVNNIMKLLIAYDGSRCAEAALDDLTHAGLPVKGEAAVLSVAEVWLPPPPPSSLEIVELAVTAKGPLGLERKYMAALRTGSDAVDHHRKVLELSPQFIDAKLTIGLQDYVIGSLPPKETRE